MKAPIAEYLCLKYVGVRTPAEIIRNAESFGWKCRKYIRWKTVHKAPEDAEILRFFADALINERKILPKFYGRVCEIFLQVQRWRFDRDHMAIEPPIRPEWEKLKQLALLARSMPSVVPAELTRAGINLVEADSRSLQIAYHAYNLDDFFRAVAGSDYEAVARKAVRKTIAEEPAKLLEAQLSPWNTLVGASIDSTAPPDQFLTMVFDSLGMDGIVIDAALRFAPQLGSTSGSTVVVRYEAFEGLRLAKAQFLKGILILTVNLAHPYVESLQKDSMAKAAFDQLMTALALSYADLSVESEVLDDFIDSLGLKLISVLRSSVHKTGPAA